MPFACRSRRCTDQGTPLQEKFLNELINLFCTHARSNCSMISALTGAKLFGQQDVSQTLLRRDTSSPCGTSARRLCTPFVTAAFARLCVRCSVPAPGRLPVWAASAWTCPSCRTVGVWLLSLLSGRERERSSRAREGKELRGYRPPTTDHYDRNTNSTVVKRRRGFSLKTVPTEIPKPSCSVDIFRSCCSKSPKSSCSVDIFRS